MLVLGAIMASSPAGIRVIQPRHGKKPINANTRAIMPRTRAAVQEGEPLQQDEGEEESEVFIMTLFYRVQ